MIPVISDFIRKRQIRRLVDRLEEHEAEMRNICALLIELSPDGDDLHVEARRLLEGLDG